MDIVAADYTHIEERIVAQMREHMEQQFNRMLLGHDDK